MYVHIYSHKVSNLPTTCQQRNRTGNKLFQQPWEADAVAATSPVLQMMLKFREVRTLIQSSEVAVSKAGSVLPSPRPYYSTQICPPRCLNPVLGNQCSNTGHGVFLQQRNSRIMSMPVRCARVPSAHCSETVQTQQALEFPHHPAKQRLPVSLNPAPSMEKDLRWPRFLRFPPRVHQIPEFNSSFSMESGVQ